MNRPLLLAGLTALLPGALLVPGAAAQSPYGNGPGTVAAVRCESINNRQQVCNTGWRDAIIVRQLSSTRCIEGQNWGSRDGTVWVGNGCRADFGPGRGGWSNGGGNGNWGGNGDTIRCESNDNRQRVCNTGWRGAVLVRQLSNTQCVEGRNWGSGNGSVWVDNGCRAEFAEGRGGNWGGGWGGGNAGNGQTIRCESNDNRQRVCNTGWRGAVLVRQLSNTQCVEGRNWGSGNGSVWVDNGCRAEFAEGRGGNWGGGWGGGNAGNGDTIRCESNDNRQRVCRTDWRRATLVRQLSKSQCIEGHSWGSSNGAVWVSDGCRAEFAEGRGGGWGGGNGGNWGGSNYSIECSSEDNRMRSCAWERRQGRPVLIQQLSRTQCVEGRNWGYNGNSVWVNGGCRARFGAR